MPISSLSPSSRALFNAPITLDNVKAAILSIPNKTLGPSILSERHKVYVDNLAPALYDLFAEFHEQGTLPKPVYQAHIVLFQKLEIDPMNCGSYRPISLPNMDLKILTKVLATCLSRVIETLVDSDHMGFIPQKSTDINIRRLFTNLQASHSNVGTRMVMELDVEKAFDVVDLQYMRLVPDRMGFEMDHPFV